MSYLSEEQLNRISEIIAEIEQLSDVEKLYLYLQLPCGNSELANPEATTGNCAASSSSARIQKQSNGRRLKELQLPKQPDEEVTQTYTWILSHLELDPNVSLPKQEVYDEYKAFCQANRFEPLCVADFGKAMKHAFPCIKPRRLGQRGNSRYCYSGLRKKYKIKPPELPTTIPVLDLNRDNGVGLIGGPSAPIAGASVGPMRQPQGPLVTGEYEDAIDLKIGPATNLEDQQPLYTGPSGNVNNFGPAFIDYHQQTSSSPGHQLNGIKQVRPKQTQQVQPQQINDLLRAPDCAASKNQIDQQASFCFLNHYPQPPGTPDDDDYRHNHMDLIQDPAMVVQTSNLPASQSSGGFAHYQATSHNQHMQQSGQQQQQQQQQLHVHLDNHRINDNHHNQQFQAHIQAPKIQPYSNYINESNSRTSGVAGLLGTQQVGPSNRQPENNQADEIGARNDSSSQLSQLQLNDHNGYLTSSQFDSCASPFQSPASTPYPMNGSGPGTSGTSMGHEPNHYIY